MLTVARVCAAISGWVALVALLGYLINIPDLVHVRTGLEGMSPLTATALLALAVAALAKASDRNGLARWSAGFAIAIGAATLVAHAVMHADTLSPAVGAAVFRMRPEQVGRTSIATGLGVLLIATALLSRRRAPSLADWASSGGLLVSGTALLGYLYGVNDLYALPMFNSMAVNTAATLFLLSLSTLLAEPDVGWASILGSSELGGGAVRRQLGFVVLPVIGGWLLLVGTSAAHIGPAVAMALLVILTVAPLAMLILRDGRILNALDRERRSKADILEHIAEELNQKLAAQASELAREAEERTRAEAAMYRAQRVEAVGQLTGGIAHDFNNLLMAIRGNLELLQGRLPADEERLHRYLGNAMAATDKGAKVTGQLLAFSRSQRLDIRAAALDPVLTSARALIGNALGPNIALKLDLDTAGVWVRTDPDQLELAILNLAVNARDAMTDGGNICVESRAGEALRFNDTEETPSVVIRVIDDGAGMTPEVAAQAVEPFFTTKARGKGTGLGLAQVYGFVRQCGGDLRISSVVGEGTTIEILLPVAVPQANDAPTNAATGAQVSSAGNGRKVLVIDDDEGVRSVIVDALRAAGFIVTEAGDGESGLALLDHVEPAAAVIDFLMPGMNGAEVARIAQLRRPGLPIVFVSGYSDTLALDGIAGAVVLRKPFDIAGLSRALSTVLH
jgi:signal transduction histidine kinase/CheY-like chemotaxis protein